MMGTQSYVIDADASVREPLLNRSATAARCACGHELGHREVLPEPAYTTWSWFLFLMGVTAKPRWVSYRCWRCKQVLAVTRDPAVLAKFD